MGVFLRIGVLVCLFFSSFVGASEPDDNPCFFCAEFMMPVLQDTVSTLVCVGGTWLVSKLVVKEYKKGRLLPGQKEQPKKSAELERRIGQLERQKVRLANFELERRIDQLRKEKEVLAGVTLFLLSAGAESLKKNEKWKRVAIRELLQDKPGTELLFKDARVGDVAVLQGVLKKREV
jgi:hypothetical protein